MLHKFTFLNSISIDNRTSCDKAGKNLTPYWSSQCCQADLWSLNCGVTHWKKRTLYGAFISAWSTCWGCSCPDWAQDRHENQSLGIRGSPRGCAVHQEAPGRGLSIWLSCFPFFSLQLFLPACSASASRGTVCVCVCACFHQIAFSSVLWALPDKCVAVIRQFDASFLHALLIESWKPPFRLVWPSYLCVPVISHLNGGILDVSHFKMF